MKAGATLAAALVLGGCARQEGLFHGWAELGQGSPTAVRMIAAEELGLSVEQVTAAQVDTNVSLSAITAGSTATSTAMGATSMRGAAAASAAAGLDRRAGAALRVLPERDDDPGR